MVEGHSVASMATIQADMLLSEGDESEAANGTKE
jgi:hypothetical protein